MPVFRLHERLLTFGAPAVDSRLASCFSLFFLLLSFEVSVIKLRVVASKEISDSWQKSVKKSKKE